MFDLLLMLSRYVFLFYIALFLWQGIVYIAYEQGGFLGSPYRAISIQRCLIVLMHVTAFLILAYNRETHLFGIQPLVFGAVSFAFLLAAIALLDRFYYEGCPLVWTGMLFLMDLSLIMLQRLSPALAHRQLLWMGIGLAGMLVLPFFFRLIPRFEVFEWAYIILCYGLLICTRFFGVEKGGSTNWLAFGPESFRITFQPSEIAKFLFVFYLASVFRKRMTWKTFFITGFLSAGLVLLLVLQKDLGGALIFFMTYMVMLYIATSNELLFLLGMGAASVAAMLAYKLFSHVRVRVAAWQNPWADIDYGGYQIVNALFAITTWGVFGSGLTKGMPKSIPVVESDMIFAAVCEEFGAAFGAGVIAIFIMLLYRGVRIALDCGRRYYAILAAGVTAMLSFQAFLILGGCIKLIPLTGVTLPFVSYGGSSVLVSLMMMGLLQWVCVYCEQHTARKMSRSPCRAVWREAASMNNMKRSIRRIFWLLALCFFLLLGYLGKLTLADRQTISGNAYNTRLRYGDDTIRRGEVTDRDGEVIARSIPAAGGGYSREYPRSRMAAHITGYSSVGKTGVEAAENFELMTLHNELFQRINSILKKDELLGNSIRLTVDMDIQSAAGNLLGNAKGAVVVMEPSTGRVLALQAYPDFDPNKVAAQWEDLKDHEDSPLLNRATQGVYPPGSTFKTITALAGIEYLPDWQAFTVECTGEASFEDKIIHCYNNKAHGVVDMKKAMETSCNCYFAALAQKIGAENLAKTMERAGMKEGCGFELAYTGNNVFLDADSTESELVETAIGQGRTGVTPLYMAMLASAIANEGLMMRPYIADHVVYPDGGTGKTTVPKKLAQICTPEEAAILKDMMVGVVENGTGTAASVGGVTVAGKTGTAENATGNDHSWFIGFAPAEEPKIAVAVLLENAKDGNASAIAGKVLRAALEEMGE